MVLDIFSKTLNGIWPIIAIFLCIIIVVRISYILINHKKVKIYEEVFLLIFIIYMLLLFEMLTATDTNNFHGMNLHPFNEITRYSFGTKAFNINVFGNILIFIPFGLFIAEYLNAKRFYIIFLISSITSFTVEVVQLKIGRSFDIDDIILNVVGSILGYLIYKFLKSLRRKLPGFLKSDVFLNIVSVLLFGLIIYWLAYRIGLV